MMCPPPCQNEMSFEVGEKRKRRLTVRTGKALVRQL